MNITNVSQIIEFGKYKGRSVKDLLTIDPEYLIWAHKNITKFTLAEHLVRLVEHTTVARL